MVAIYGTWLRTAQAFLQGSPHRIASPNYKEATTPKRWPNMRGRLSPGLCGLVLGIQRSAGSLHCLRSRAAAPAKAPGNLLSRRGAEGVGAPPSAERWVTHVPNVEGEWM